MTTGNDARPTPGRARGTASYVLDESGDICPYCLTVCGHPDVCGAGLDEEEGE